MNVVKIKHNIEIIDCDSPMITLRKAIAQDLKDLNLYNKTGALNSFRLTQDRLNAKIDQYMKIKTLRRVK